MKYYFIVNTNSRSGKGLAIWNEIKDKLKEFDSDVQVYLTKHRGNAMRIVQKITTDHRKQNGKNATKEKITIVALGGDGTINEMVNGIVDFENVILGYIPTGSGNDLAKGLGITRDPIEGLKVVLGKEPVIKTIDIGEVKRGELKRRFAVACGMGFDASICHYALVSKFKYFLNKINLGRLTYVGIAIRRIFAGETFTVEMTIDDGEPRVFEKTYFVTTMNNPYEGGGFMFCPKACQMDGIFDVIIVSKVPKLKILAVLPTAFWGKHVMFSGIDLFRGKKVVIKAKEPMMLHVDGETLFPRKHVEVSVLPSTLNIIVG